MADLQPPRRCEPAAECARKQRDIHHIRDLRPRRWVRRARRGGAQGTGPSRRRGDSSGRTVVSCDLPDAWMAAVQADKRALRPVPSIPSADLGGPWLAAELDQSRPASLLFELLRK